MSVNSKMTAIANATRALDGSTATLTLDGIASKLGVEKSNIDAALAALVEKEVDVPAGSTSAALASLIASIEAGGGKIASGSITPLDETYEIVHNLGETPAVFMWYPEFVSITGRILASSNGLSTETIAIDSADWNGHVGYKTKPVLFMTKEKLLTYSMNSNIDWGYFTVDQLSLLNSTSTIYCNEEKFYGKSGVFPIIPYSTSGNITIHWFAIGGQ